MFCRRIVNANSGREVKVRAMVSCATPHIAPHHCMPTTFCPCSRCQTGKRRAKNPALTFYHVTDRSTINAPTEGLTISRSFRWR